MTTNPGATHMVKEQGKSWETWLATNRYSDMVDLPDGFKYIDFYDPKTGTAISAKTIDTMRPGYAASPQNVYNALKRYTDQLNNYTTSGYSSKITGEYFHVEASNVKDKVLDVSLHGVPSGSHQKAIQQAVDYAKSKGINLKITFVGE